MIIRGNAVGNIRTNWNQTDPEKADYLLGREDLNQTISNAQKAGNNAQKTADSKADLVTASATLSAGNWSNNVQTVNVSGVTSDKAKCHVIPLPDPANHALYYDSGVYCTEQLNGKLTFACEETPGTDIIVNLLILIEGVAS